MTTNDTRSLVPRRLGTVAVETLAALCLSGAVAGCSSLLDVNNPNSVPIEEIGNAAAAKSLANGVQTGIHYPIPVHLQPAYADLGYREGQFPQAERAAAEVLSLPMYPELSSTQRETVSAVLREEAYVI